MAKSAIQLQCMIFASGSASSLSLAGPGSHRVHVSCRSLLVLLPTTYRSVAVLPFSCQPRPPRLPRLPFFSHDFSVALLFLYPNAPFNLVPELPCCLPFDCAMRSLHLVVGPLFCKRRMVSTMNCHHPCHGASGHAADGQKTDWHPTKTSSRPVACLVI
jgi:hypothetical protein